MKWQSTRCGAQIRNYSISVQFNVTVYVRSKQRQTIQSLVGGNVAQVYL